MNEVGDNMGIVVVVVGSMWVVGRKIEADNQVLVDRVVELLCKGLWRVGKLVVRVSKARKYEDGIGWVVAVVDTCVDGLMDWMFGGCVCLIQQPWSMVKEADFVGMVGR